MLKSYKYRLLPTDEQKNTLAKWFGACRFIFNLGLESKIAAWTSLRKNVTSFDLMKQLTELKKTECKWLSEVPRQSLESSITNLDKAYIRFFNGAGFPKFKKPTGHQSIQFRQYTKIKEGKIFLTKIGGIDFIQHRPLGAGEIRTTSVSKTPSGDYFVSIMIEDGKKIPIKKSISEETAIGLDMGLKNFCSFSDGVTISNPKYLHQQLKKLKKEQRTLERRYQKGLPTNEQSKGWYKQKIIVAKLYQKICNQRRDFLQKVSSAVINKYDTICLETLNISGLAKNKILSKSISEVGWGDFNRMIEYKAKWTGKNILKIGTFFPSSKMCSFCGVVNKHLKLSDRKWTCSACGAVHDRDLNAAKNIKNFGLNPIKKTTK